RSGQQCLQRRREIMRLRARYLFEHPFDTLKFIGQHSLEQIDLARKMGIKRLLADTQFLRQIVHGHTAESVTEKMRTRRSDYSLSNRRVLAGSRSRFVCDVHEFGSAASGTFDIRPTLDSFVRPSSECKCITGCCSWLISRGYKEMTTFTMETNMVYLVSDATEIFRPHTVPFRSTKLSACCVISRTSTGELKVEQIEWINYETRP